MLQFSALRKSVHPTVEETAMLRGTIEELRGIINKQLTKIIKFQSSSLMAMSLHQLLSTRFPHRLNHTISTQLRSISITLSLIKCCHRTTSTRSHCIITLTRTSLQLPHNITSAHLIAFIIVAAFTEAVAVSGQQQATTLPTSSSTIRN